MKSKQLANILIKILGLSVLIQSVNLIISGIPLIIYARDGRNLVMSNMLHGPILLLIGIFLIIKSRKLAEFLFKNEDE